MEEAFEGGDGSAEPRAATRLRIGANGLGEAIGPDDPDIRAYHESLVRGDYDRLYPDDTFEYLKRRARFSKHDRGLLRDWMATAAARAAQREARDHSDGPDSLAA